MWLYPASYLQGGCLVSSAGVGWRQPPAVNSDVKYYQYVGYIILLVMFNPAYTLETLLPCSATGAKFVANKFGPGNGFCVIIATYLHC